MNGLNLLTGCGNSFTTAKKGLSDFQFLQWKNLDLFPSFSIVKTNGFTDRVFTLIVRTLIVLDVYNYTLSNSNK